MIRAALTSRTTEEVVWRRKKGKELEPKTVAMAASPTLRAGSAMDARAGSAMGVHSIKQVLRMCVRVCEFVRTC